MLSKSRMEAHKNIKEDYLNQYKELEEMAGRYYPDIKDTISLMDNITAETNNLQDFLNLSNQEPPETSSNQISIT